MAQLINKNDESFVQLFLLCLQSTVPTTEICIRVERMFIEHLSARIFDPDLDSSYNGM